MENNTTTINSEIYNVLNLINLIITSNSKLNELVSKANLNITPQQTNELIDILKYISQEINGNSGIKNIINETIKISVDNKIELYEIPQLINVIYESLNGLNTITISTNDIGILLKIIIFILIDTNIIKIPSQDLLLINSLIEMSTTLLNKSVNIKIPKKSSFICC